MFLQARDSSKARYRHGKFSGRMWWTMTELTCWSMICTLMKILKNWMAEVGWRKTSRREYFEPLAEHSTLLEKLPSGRRPNLSLMYYGSSTSRFRRPRSRHVQSTRIIIGISLRYYITLYLTALVIIKTSFCTSTNKNELPKPSTYQISAT